MKWMAVVVLGLVLGGCVTHDYVGERYAPTDHVRVFYDSSSVPAGYSVIGQDRAEATEYMTTEDIVKDMVKKAREVGADAVLIDGVETVAVGSSTTTRGSSDGDTEYYLTDDGELRTRHKPSGKWNENSYSTIQRDKVVTARFLKMK